MPGSAVAEPSALVPGSARLRHRKPQSGKDPTNDFNNIASNGKRAGACTIDGMRRRWISIIVLTGATLHAATSVRAPSPDLTRAEALYLRTEYGHAIETLKAAGLKHAAEYALLGKAYFMDGQYKEAVASLERAVAADGLNSEYYDWLGKAYGRLAESSNPFSALGLAKKTVRAFERAVDMGPSNLEALSDVFEYYLEAPGLVGGGVDKAEKIAGRVALLNVAEYHWFRARLAEKRKDFAAAECEYRSALSAEPNQVGRMLDLAAFLSARGRYGESDALFEAVQERYPDSPKILFARAAAYIQSKRRLDEAQTLLKGYIDSQTTPEDPPRREARALMKRARELADTARRTAQSGIDG
jgi:tetratricopeptide (TPR) repeat protein